MRALLRRWLPEAVKRPLRLARKKVWAALRPSAVACRVRGLQIVIGTSSESEDMRVQTYETKEPETLTWLDSGLREGDVIFDVGANIGLYSIYAAKRCPGVVVYAFEPESQNFARLCLNIVRNGVSSVMPCSIPLADREAFDWLYVSKLEAGYALHSFGESSPYESARAHTALKQGAISVTLDALVEKYHLPQPTLIKLDVDGLENRILNGGRNVLRSPRLRSLLVEWNYQVEEEIDQLELQMKELGLVLEARSEWRADSDGLLGENLIFGRRIPSGTDKVVGNESCVGS